MLTWTSSLKWFVVHQLWHATYRIGMNLWIFYEFLVGIAMKAYLFCTFVWCITSECWFSLNITPHCHYGVWSSLLQIGAKENLTKKLNSMRKVRKHNTRRSFDVLVTINNTPNWHSERGNSCVVHTPCSLTLVKTKAHKTDLIRFGSIPFDCLSCSTFCGSTTTPESASNKLN